MPHDVGRELELGHFRLSLLFTLPLIGFYGPLPLFIHGLCLLAQVQLYSQSVQLSA